MNSTTLISILLSTLIGIAIGVLSGRSPLMKMTIPSLGGKWLGTLQLVSVRKENRDKSIDPTRWVGLAPAFHWCCPKCKLDRFVLPPGAVVQHITHASIEARDSNARYMFGMMVGEHVACFAACAPSKVSCPHCHRVYYADIPEAELLQEAEKLRLALSAPPQDSFGESAQSNVTA